MTARYTLRTVRSYAIHDRFIVMDRVTRHKAQGVWSTAAVAAARAAGRIHSDGAGVIFLYRPDAESTAAELNAKEAQQ